MDERFCVKINLPRLDDLSERMILKFVNNNDHRLIGWSFIDNKVSSTRPQDFIGFSNLRITDEVEINFFKNILESNNINFDYTNLVFAVQRSRNTVFPHTDPGRTATLQYLIKGSATTKFWSMDDFVPDISYSGKKLKLESEFKIDCHSWYLYNNSAIHSAHDIEGDERVQLAVVLTYRFKDFEDAKINFQKILR